MSEVEPGECGMGNDGVRNSLRVWLFVAGDSPSSRRARRAVEDLLTAQASEHGARFEVVDVLRFPERALEYKLLATPTLIIERGDSVTRYVGDLYDGDDVLEELSQLSSGR